MPLEILFEVGMPTRDSVPPYSREAPDLTIHRCCDMANTINSFRSTELSFTAVQLADIFGLHIKTVRKWRLQGQVKSTPAGSRLKINYDELLALINRGKRIDRRGALQHGLDPDRVLADAEIHTSSRPPVNHRGPFLCQEDLPSHYAVEVGLRRLSGQSLEVIREDLGLSGHAILALQEDFKRRLQAHYAEVGDLRTVTQVLNAALVSLERAND